MSSLEASAITFGPGTLGELHGEASGPAAGRLHHDRLPLLDVRAVVKQRVGGQALEQQARRLLVVDLVGERHQPGLGDGRLLGVAAVREQRRDPASVRRRAADLGAWDQWQGLLGEVVVADRVGVREVDSGAGHVDDDHAVGRLRVGDVDVLEVLGPAELLDLNSLHPSRICR